jgi:hypothetical protein
MEEATKQTLGRVDYATPLPERPRRDVYLLHASFTLGFSLVCFGLGVALTNDSFRESERYMPGGIMAIGGLLVGLVTSIHLDRLTRGRG